MKRFVLILIICLWGGTAWADHPIASAQFNQGGSIHVTMNDGRAFDVPDDMKNRHRRQIAEWEAEGNTIAAYVAPVVTDDDRIGSAFPLSDREQVLFEVLFELTNRLRAQESLGALTRAQFRDWLKTKLP
ncbi:MAG: hypothetical protein GWM98_15460 [Nitrospinaceae bacterium]|nr:hypothetical protein [Nitrospinaceae bacterium]NIR55622.1 hypothetical protein [Nitrospinaceae bacterium]NIS86056.1 hypothetical protein [Nitrospinaceae bacterium]NIT82899.1 hypothetical protein [Nitrospinaceae bacterium]NIU45104.1 hypothetical protein [Nitrospinaceae bacterium]